MQHKRIQRAGRAVVDTLRRALARPVTSSTLVVEPHPAQTYEEACARLQAIQQDTPSAVLKVCQYRAMLHQTTTATVVVCIHGFTSCPQQFVPLAQELFAHGCNVLLPRIPHHGLEDRLTSELAQLTAAEWVVTTSEAVDIARGLGQRVVIVGISAGAVAAAWVVQQRHDIAQAVLLAPSFGVANIPAAFTRPMTFASVLLPNLYLWWDPRYRADSPGPTYSYPRFSTRALGQIFSLGRAVLDTAQQAPVGIPTTVITSPTDLAVNAALINTLVQRWQHHADSHVQHYIFPAALGVIHDMLDPNQVGQKTKDVYPVLIKIIVDGAA